MTDDTARRDALREALHAELHPHKTFDAFDCRCAEIAERLAALAAPAAEPRLQRSHNHKIDGHHWQDCPGCDDIRAAAQPGPSEPGLTSGEVELLLQSHALLGTLVLHAERDGMWPHYTRLARKAYDDAKHLQAKPLSALAAADSAPGEGLLEVVREFIRLHDEADEPVIWCDGKCRTVRRLREYAALSEKHQEDGTE